MTCLTYDLHLYILKTVVADSRESARPVTCFPWSVQTRCGSPKVMPVDRGADYDAPSEGLRETSELFGISPSTASIPGPASRQANLRRHGWRPQTDPAGGRQRLGFRNCSASFGRRLLHREANDAGPGRLDGHANIPRHLLTFIRHRQMLKVDAMPPSQKLTA